MLLVVIMFLRNAPICSLIDHKYTIYFSFISYCKEHFIYFSQFYLLTIDLYCGKMLQNILSMEKRSCCLYIYENN